MSDFGAIFGRSPVKPLQEHMEVCARCARQLEPLFQAVLGGDWDAVRKYRDRISDLESQADELKKQIRSGLGRSLFMAVRREDLLEMVLVQDKIANRCKDVSGLIVGRRMDVPPCVHDELREFVQCIIDAVDQADRTVHELDELFETGFRGAEVELVQSLINELDQLESKTDKLQSRIRNRLFEVERDYPPIDMVFLYQVIGLVGEVGDMAERVGRRLELMLSN